MHVRGFHQEEKEIELRSLDVVGLQVRDHFDDLDEAEVLFSVILHPESATPDIDPSDVHIGSLSPADLWNDYLLSLEHGSALF